MSVSLRMKSVSWIIVIAVIDFHTVFCFQNFALKKVANQSSTLSYKNFEWTADKAVDGKENKSSPDISRICSATNSILGNHTWEVDIGFQVIVKNITVYGRSDQGNDDHLSGFLLYIGNVSSPWTYDQPVDETSSENYRHVFQPKDSVARFISVVRRNQQILMICEVQVFGECLDGVYSEFCNKTCGHCYAGLLCNKETGDCLKGCDLGWEGETCDTECENGTYGYGCNETCGNCLAGNKSCSMRDGNCTSGCTPGWQGITCKQKCKNGTYSYDCNEACGRCLKGNDSCSVIDGHCIGGCKAGWQGQTCKTEERENPDSNSQHSKIPIIVVSVVTVLFVLMLIAVIVALKIGRSRRTRNANQGTMQGTSNECFYVNVNVHNTGEVNRANMERLYESLDKASLAQRTTRTNDSSTNEGPDRDTIHYYEKLSY